MGPHIDSAVKKCHGLLGIRRRAADYLPRELLKLVYTSVIRSHLEYCSATFIHSAPTHLNKLDIIQKIASRIIAGSYDSFCGVPAVSRPKLKIGSSKDQRRLKFSLYRKGGWEIRIWLPNFFS